MTDLNSPKQILPDFYLTLPQLVEIAQTFNRRIKQGLNKENTEIKCLPLFVFPVQDKFPRGIAYVLDLGGSHLRAAVVSIDKTGIKFLTPIKSIKMPWKRHVDFPKDTFLSLQAGLLQSLDYPHACPLGYCFSYPANALPDGDATMIKWTKGLHVPGTIGENIGTMLTEHIGKHHPEVKITSVCVLNDTVASLFAGLSEGKKDAYIGLIAGTGTNMAAFFPARSVPKLKIRTEHQKMIPINLESGNFAPPFLGQWDRIVDANSENEGEQLLEKAVSGMYLGRIFKAAFPDSDFDPDSGAEGLVGMLNSPTGVPQSHRIGAGAIYERSIKLIASQQAGLIDLLAETSSIGTVKIVAEGGLFWSKIHQQKSYAERVQNQLETLLKRMGRSDVKIEIQKLDQANLIGSAIAALSKIN